MAQVLHAKALFECQGDEESELSFLEGDILVNGNALPSPSSSKAPIGLPFITMALIDLLSPPLL